MISKVTMPRTYPIDVRRQLCDRVLAGEPVVAIAAEPSLSRLGETLSVNEVRTLRA